MLRCTVAALLAASAAGYVYVLVAQHGRRACCTVKHLLHVLMAVAMIVMLWPVGTALPTVAPIAFFLLAAIWFVLLPARIPYGSGRLVDGYHAVAMTAMAWMYAVMDSSLSGSAGIQMSGMEMPARTTPAIAAEPWWITTVNWTVAAAFAVATLWWLYRYFAERRTDPPPRRAQPARPDRIGLLSHAFMGAGAAIMFGAML